MCGKPKNLLFILADQFRHDVLGKTSGGRVHTPNLDRLAEGGMLYTRAYTPLPVCAPARQALVTGRHPDSYGAYWNYGFFPTPPIDPRTTWTRQMAEAGFSMGYVGKWNISPSHGPSDFGFSHIEDAGAYDRFVNARYPGLSLPGGFMGCANPVPLCHSHTHFLSDQALSALKSMGGGSPWCLWLDLGMPHLPCRPSAPFSEMYPPETLSPWPGYDDPFVKKPYCHRQQMYNWRLEGMPWQQMAPQVSRYLGMVSQIDDAVGRLLKGLSDSGQMEDTLIVFTSDHGDMCGSHRMLDKHYVLYDDVVRVPLILSGPGIPKGESAQLVSNCLDLPPSISRWFSLEGLPGGHGIPLPLGGEGGRSHITSSSNGQQFGMFNSRMITDGQVKYVWNLTDIDELYDLSCDPGELHNLIGDPALAGGLSRLRKALYDVLTRQGDPFVRGDWVSPQLLEGRKTLPNR